MNISIFDYLLPYQWNPLTPLGRLAKLIFYLPSTILWMLIIILSIPIIPFTDAYKYVRYGEKHLNINEPVFWILWIVTVFPIGVIIAVCLSYLKL